MGQIKDRNGNVVAEVEDLSFLVNPYICVYEAVKPRINDNMHLVERELVGNIKMYIRFNVDKAVAEKMGDDREASVVVTKEIIDHMGMNEEFLFQRAIRNTPGQLKNIFCEMEELSGVDSGYEGPLPPIFVARTQDRLVNAAGCLGNIKWLEEIREKMGDFYIIPASKNELIFVDGKLVEEKGIEDLQWMVREVNGTTLLPGDKLSDDVFKFDTNGLHVA